MIKIARKIVSLIVICVLFLTISFSYNENALANLRQQEEMPGQILYQSRHSLQDNKGQAWQLILFKRVKDGKVKDVDLRLVGFPDVVKFVHPENLTFKTLEGKEFTAPDQFAQESPANNVGQYNVKDILINLAQEKSVKVDLPVQENLSLNIPYPVLLEWEQIANY
jgi:hypothetical protein